MPSPNHLKEIKNFLEKNEDFIDLFRYNLMTKDIEFTRKANIQYWPHGKCINDEDLVHIKDYISEITGKEYNKGKIEEAVMILSKRQAYNPLTNYLNSLEWDGVKRVDFWLNLVCGVEKNIYTETVGRKVLCGAVARAFNPGCKFDYMLILEGEQGIGKTTMLEILGDQWYLNTHISGSDKKDMIDIMRTAWIIEIADMAGFNKSDIQHLRAFIDRKVDRVRLPYDKRSRDFPRQCILIGTHNPSGDNQYFKDDTGNRRYWPVFCNWINVELLKKCRDQLFAEAKVMLNNGEKLFIDNNQSLNILSEMHKAREVSTPWDGLFDRFLIGRDKVSSQEIIEGAFGIKVALQNFRELRSKQTILGNYMKKHGWRKDKDGYYVNNHYQELNLNE